MAAGAGVVAGAVVGAAVGVASAPVPVKFAPVVLNCCACLSSAEVGVLLSIGETAGAVVGFCDCVCGAATGLAGACAAGLVGACATGHAGAAAGLVGATTGLAGALGLAGVV